MTVIKIGNQHILAIMVTEVDHTIYRWIDSYGCCYTEESALARCIGTLRGKMKHEAERRAATEYEAAYKSYYKEKGEEENKGPWGEGHVRQAYSATDKALYDIVYKRVNPPLSNEEFEEKAKKVLEGYTYKIRVTLMNGETRTTEFETRAKAEKGREAIIKAMASVPHTIIELK